MDVDEHLVDEQPSRVGGAIGRGVEEARHASSLGLWEAYEAYRERLERASSVPDGTDG